MPGGRQRLRRTSRALWVAGALALVAGTAVLAALVDTDALAVTARAALASPGAVAAAVGAYGLAFILRAWLWRRVLPDLRFAQALAALHLALAGNHVLPLRLGEALRVTSVARRTDVPLAAAAASTVTLRAADVLGLVALIAVLGGATAAGMLADWSPTATGASRPATAGIGASLGPAAWAFTLAGALVGAGAWLWLRRVAHREGLRVRPPGPAVAVGACAAWVLESAVLWQAAAFAGIGLDAADAVLVTAVTVAAQVVAVAPAGVGTYEAAGTAGLVAFGARPGPALAAALSAHALKTGYALAAGAVAAVAPAPGLFGRLRLPARRAGARPTVAPETCEPPSDAPIVLFLPACDEEATVGEVVRRTPERLLGRRVVCLVVDDGSRDRTAARAAADGARVVSLPANRGLGAAVRRGIAEALALGAALIAFCDADGEYAPEELERVAAPILAGEADYVVGSRFAGGPARMLAHRRVANRMLSRLLSVLARAPISDGQSGYRALSAAAAADAEIIHDFNYAQVLTLDLLAKGYRYAEVPISYHFRTAGRSFVRPGAYLRAVIPAVHRELNTPSAPRPSRRPADLGGR